MQYLQDDENDETLYDTVCVSQSSVDSDGNSINNDSIMWFLITFKTGLILYTSYLSNIFFLSPLFLEVSPIKSCNCIIGFHLRALPSLFNEAKYIGVSSYNMCVCGLLLVGLDLALSGAHEVYFIYL